MKRRWNIEERLEWRAWTTPKGLRDKPIHRWLVFPHSYTPELAHALIEEWGLGSDDVVLDPFAGAGTTVLGAKERGVPATGYDLSPLAVLAARTKVSPLRRKLIEKEWTRLRDRLLPADWSKLLASDYPDLVWKALPGHLLVAFDWIKQQIHLRVPPGPSQDFFLLGLLATIPEFSRAVATGGWLKWVDRRRPASRVPAAFSARISAMLEDVPVSPEQQGNGAAWNIVEADARALPDRKPRYSAVITSPPYPNRHDYTRVFGVELMFGLLDWEGTRRLRYQSFHSHPEAKPKRPDGDGYRMPRILKQVVSSVREAADDERVAAMLEGYFLDMYLCLKETRRVCRPGARIAFVVGNAQYNGEELPVDELTADSGEQAGLTCEQIIVARYRGNSAQQMRRFGRNPSRESVVVFRRV